jgi:hypothetical protein
VVGAQKLLLFVFVRQSKGQQMRRLRCGIHHDNHSGIVARSG